VGLSGVVTHLGPDRRLDVPSGDQVLVHGVLGGTLRSDLKLILGSTYVI
jgi:hypothetical protein